MSTSDPDKCGARLYDDRQDLRCNRKARHYNKPHRAIVFWVESSGGPVSAVVTWAVSGIEWADDPA